MKAFIWILALAMATNSLAKKDEKPDDRGKRGVFGEHVLLQPSSGLQIGLQNTPVEQPIAADLYSSQQLSSRSQPNQLALQNVGWNQQVAIPLSLQSTAAWNLQNAPLILQASSPNLQEARLNFNAYPLSLNSAPRVPASLNNQYLSQNLQAPINTASLYSTSNIQSFPLALQNVQVTSQSAPLNLGPSSYVYAVQVSLQGSPLSVNNALVNTQANPWNQGAALNSQYAPLNLQYTPVNSQYANDNKQYASLNSQYAPVNSQNSPLISPLISQYSSVPSQYSPLNSQYPSVNSQYAPLNTQYESVNTQNAPLNSQYASVNLQNSPLISQYSSAQSQYVPLNSQYPSVNSQYAPLNTQYESVNTQNAPLNSPYAPVNSQNSPLISQYASVQSQYSPLNSQYAPVNTQNSQINSQYTQLNGNQVDANLQVPSLNQHPAPLSRQAPFNLQQQYAATSALKSPLTFRASTNLNLDWNTQASSVKSVPLNLNNNPSENNQSPITLIAVPLDQSSPLNHRPQNQPPPNQAQLVPLPLYGPTGPSATSTLVQNRVESPQVFPSYGYSPSLVQGGDNLQRAVPIQSYGAASYSSPLTGQSYGSTYPTPLIRAGIDNIQKSSKVHKVVKVPVTVNIGYVSRVNSDQKFIRIEPSVEIPVQNPVSVEATRQAGAW